MQYQTYKLNECVYFRRTKEQFGGLSNMAAGFPLKVNGVQIRTAEALYQACKFPHMPEIQRQIISEKSPMTAKMVAYRGNLAKQWRSDWLKINIRTMHWCLRVKLAQNYSSFGELLLSTESKLIVEHSAKDAFWGAKIVNNTLVGANILGRLLMELREAVRSEEFLLAVSPPDITDFMLYSEPIREISGEANENR